jgi:DnaJ like chaperone protein
MSIWTDMVGLARQLFTDDESPARETPAAARLGTSPGWPACGEAVGEVQCGPDANDVEFTAAVVGLGAKLAKADGLVTPDEVQMFARVFRAPPGEEIAVGRVFNLARQTVRGYEGYARRLGKRYADRPCLLEGVLDGLFQIALADGVMTDDELSYLESVSEAFGFSDADFRRIRASHLEPEADDPYAVLGVPHDAGFDTVRSAYRRLMLENHPDALAASRGAPREFEAVAHAKAAAITGAYARIRAERGFVARPD